MECSQIDTDYPDEGDNEDEDIWRAQRELDAWGTEQEDFVYTIIL